MTRGVLLLAAGASQRFGSDKRYARLASGETILEACIRTIQEAQLPLMVCLRSGDNRSLELLWERRVECCECVNSRHGIGATLAESVGRVSHWDAALVSLADMPYIQAATFRTVAKHIDSERICVPRYEGTQGHPVGFGRLFFPALATLTGDEGARKLLRRHSNRIKYLDVDDAGILRDIDRQEDLY